MRLVLPTLAFLTACMTSVAAQPGATSLPAPSGPSKAAGVANTVSLAVTGDAGTRRQLQTGNEVVKVNLAHTPPPARPIVQTSTRAPADAKPVENERSYGTLLAALVLMVAIAARRSKAGRP